VYSVLHEQGISLSDLDIISTVRHKERMQWLYSVWHYHSIRDTFWPSLAGQILQEHAENFRSAALLQVACSVLMSDDSLLRSFTMLNFNWSFFQFYIQLRYLILYCNKESFWTPLSCRMGFMLVSVF